MQVPSSTHFCNCLVVGNKRVSPIDFVRLASMVPPIVIGIVQLINTRYNKNKILQPFASQITITDIYLL